MSTHAYDRRRAGSLIFGSAIVSALGVGALAYTSTNAAFTGTTQSADNAFEAATGRPLWSFRVAPGVRRISMFGKALTMRSKPPRSVSLTMTAAPQRSTSTTWFLATLCPNAYW